MTYPTKDQVLLGWAHRDDADALDPAPTLRPADRRFLGRFIAAVALLVLLSSATGFIAGTFIPAPASRCAPHIALWEP